MSNVTDYTYLAAEIAWDQFKEENDYNTNTIKGHLWMDRKMGWDEGNIIEMWEKKMLPEIFVL